MAHVDSSDASDAESPDETLDAPPEQRVARDGSTALISLWGAHTLLALSVGLLIRAETHPLVGWLLLGTVLSQWALLAAWAVLGSQPLFARQACALGTGVLFLILGPPDFFSWLTAFFGSQIPFWVAKLGWNWQLKQDSRATFVGRLPQFSLRWLMLLVLGCSVLFALVRFLVGSHYLSDLLFMIVVWVVGSAILAASVVPLIAVMMTVKKQRLLRWVGAAFLGVIAIVTVLFWLSMPHSPPIFIVFAFGYVGVVAGTLFVLRMAGYRLSTTHYHGGRKATPLV